MTDNDITKAKEHFTYGITHDIFSEPVTSYAKTALWAFEEVNRQKAEIERLQTVEYVIPARHCGRTQFIRLYIKDIEKKAIQEFWNQRPPHLNPEFKGKEQYNKGWNDCLALFTEEYEIFLGVKNRKAETVGDME